jgi:putative transcriptional regulator
MTGSSEKTMEAMSVPHEPDSGCRVAEARRPAGLTQPRLAERVGVGRATIARIEVGTSSPSVAVALAIGRELGETVEALFGGER